MKNKTDIEWFRKFAHYISNNANDVYNDAVKFADSKEIPAGLEERVIEYFSEYAVICQYKILGTYEIFFMDNKYYANDTKELIDQIWEILHKEDSDFAAVDDFLNEYI